MRAVVLPLAVAILSSVIGFACARVQSSTQPDASPDVASVPDTGGPESWIPFDAVSSDITDTGEWCPDPSFPPRTDGCPCNPRGAPCTAANENQKCFYPGLCGPGVSKYEICVRILAGGDSTVDEWDWVKCEADCETGVPTRPCPTSPVTRDDAGLPP